MQCHTVTFARHQRLPAGYSVEWWEADEMYHWVVSGDLYSVPCCCRWMAYRGAQKHAKDNAQAIVLNLPDTIIMAAE
jgi:hypothetical protein